MARELGKDVVAVGVEREDDVAYLRAMGCDYAQGFFFGEPMTEREVMQLINALVKSNKRDERREKKDMDPVVDTLPQAGTSDVDPATTGQPQYQLPVPIAQAQPAPPPKKKGFLSALFEHFKRKKTSKKPASAKPKRPRKGKKPPKEGRKPSRKEKKTAQEEITPSTPEQPFPQTPYFPQEPSSLPLQEPAYTQAPEPDYSQQAQPPFSSSETDFPMADTHSLPEAIPEFLTRPDEQRAPAYSSDPFAPPDQTYASRDPFAPPQDPFSPPESSSPSYPSPDPFFSPETYSPPESTYSSTGYPSPESTYSTQDPFMSPETDFPAPDPFFPTDPPYPSQSAPDENLAEVDEALPETPPGSPYPVWPMSQPPETALAPKDYREPRRKRS
jgi:hypothetical protein